MKPEFLNKATLALIAVCILLISNLITCLVWQHECVLHHAAFFEANSWGIVSFHWNDVSYAQVPFQDHTPFQKIMDHEFQKLLDSKGIE